MVAEARHIGRRAVPGVPGQDELGSPLHFYGYRFYHAALGRFINRDPIEEAGGHNLDAKVRNNFPNAWDSMGLSASGGSSRNFFTVTCYPDTGWGEASWLDADGTMVINAFRLPNPFQISDACDPFAVIYHDSWTWHFPDFHRLYQDFLDSLPHDSPYSPEAGRGEDGNPSRVQLSQTDCAVLEERIMRNLAALGDIHSRGLELNHAATAYLEKLWDEMGYPAALTGYAEGLYHGFYRIGKGVAEDLGSRQWRRTMSRAYKNAAPYVNRVGGLLTGMDVVQLGVDLWDRDPDMFISHSAEMALGLSARVPALNLVVIPSRMWVRSRLDELETAMEDMDAAGVAAFAQETSRNVLIGSRSIERWRTEWINGDCARFSN
jgi:RHS repeat-associated protein